MNDQRPTAPGARTSATARQQEQRPWEHSGLLATQMKSHRGHNGVSLRTPWMARSMVRYLLTDWRATAALVDVAELLASELVTNAVRLELSRQRHWRHVSHITLAVWYVPELVVIEVSDQNDKPPEIRVPDEDSENGRGLQLVDALSCEWSYYYPRAGWKTVFFVVGEREPNQSRKA